MVNMQMPDKALLKRQGEAFAILTAGSIGSAMVALIALALCVFYTNEYVVKFHNEGLNLVPFCDSTISSRRSGAAWYANIENSQTRCLETTAASRTLESSIFVVMCSFGSMLLMMFFATASWASVRKAARSQCELMGFYIGFIYVVYWASNVGLCWSGLPYVNQFIPTQQRVEIYPTLVPSCFWTLEAFQYMIVLAPCLLGIALALSCEMTSVTSTVQLIATLMIISSVQLIYGRYMPVLYRDGSDGDKMVYRLIVHTAAMEIASIPGRKLAQSLYANGNSYGIYVCTLGERFGSMYSRLLVNAATSEVYIAISAVCLSVIEVGMRITVFQRDALMAKLVAKITGSGGKDLFATERSQQFRKQLIILQSSCELTDVVVMGAFFAMLLQLDGPLKQTMYSKINRQILYDVGFRVEEYIMTNTAIQLGVEIGTDMLLVYIEYRLGIEAVTLLSWTNNRTFVLSFYAFFMSFGLLYVYFFAAVLFFYPIIPQKDFGGVVARFDLEFTWINYMPNQVEVSYAQEFVKTL